MAIEWQRNVDLCVYILLVQSRTGDSQAQMFRRAYLTTRPLDVPTIAAQQYHLKDMLRGFDTVYVINDKAVTARRSVHKGPHRQTRAIQMYIGFGTRW